MAEHSKIANPLPWTWEEHELSEGYSCIVYDANGIGVPGLDHLTREVARQTCDCVNRFASLRTVNAALERAGFRRG